MFVLGVAYAIVITIFCIILLFLHFHNKRCIKVISVEYLENRIAILEKKLGLIQKETKRIKI